MICITCWNVAYTLAVSEGRPQVDCYMEILKGGGCTSAAPHAISAVEVNTLREFTEPRSARNGRDAEED